MATKKRSCNSLPEELLFDILSRLPVKSLIRLELVCKLWQFIISNTSFVQAHLANSHKKRAVLLNYRYSKNRPEKYIEVHDTYGDFVELNLPPQVTDLYSINSCDGLVCLSNFPGTVIHICNPATKKLKLLPTPEKQSSLAHIGLGFDSVSNDYKLLKIAFRYPYGDTSPAEPKLYSANADSWKDIQIPKRLQRIKPPRRSKLISIKSGVLYLATETDLLAFDLHEEVFRIYPFRNFERRHVMSDVFDFEGYVAMIFQDSGRSALSLYILDDVCGKVSWTKLFNLEADIKIDWVVRYLGIGEFIAHNCANNCIFNYDYKTGETKKCLLKLSCSSMCYPAKYTESLVSISGFEPSTCRSGRYK